MLAAAGAALLAFGVAAPAVARRALVGAGGRSTLSPQHAVTLAKRARSVDPLLVEPLLDARRSRRSSRARRSTRGPTTPRRRSAQPAEPGDLALRRAVRARARLPAARLRVPRALHRARPEGAPGARARSPTGARSRSSTRASRPAEPRLAGAEHDGELAAVQRRRLQAVERADDVHVQVAGEAEPSAAKPRWYMTTSSRSPGGRRCPCRGSGSRGPRAVRGGGRRGAGAAVAVEDEDRRSPSAASFGLPTARFLAWTTVARRAWPRGASAAASAWCWTAWASGFASRTSASADEHDQLERGDEARDERRRPPGADQGVGVRSAHPSAGPDSPCARRLLQLRPWRAPASRPRCGRGRRRARRAARQPSSRSISARRRAPSAGRRRAARGSCRGSAGRCRRPARTPRAGRRRSCRGPCRR